MIDCLLDDDLDREGAERYRVAFDGKEKKLFVRSLYRGVEIEVLRTKNRAQYFE